MPNTAVAQPSVVPATESLSIRGARVHNLKSVDVDIPRNRLVVMTGPSGAGKSSLAFDTIYAEGQRQYIETLSVYVRQFLHQMERPDVDSIEGLQPTLCIDQSPANANPRSTVATVTEVYDYLRILMARCGDVFCFKCGTPIRHQSLDQIADRLLQLPERTKLMVLAPMIRGRRGAHRDVIASIRKAGFVRARVDGQVFDIDQVPELEPRKIHAIEAVVDRIIIRDGISARLGESVNMAAKFGDGLVAACYETKTDDDELVWQDELFNTLYACPDCHISYEELEPRTFSFNSPYGACPKCGGLGRTEQFAPELLLPDHNLSIEHGAVAAWKGLTPKALKKELERISGFLEQADLSTADPLATWPPARLEHFLFGDGKSFEGLTIILEKEFSTTTQESRLERLAALRDKVVCRGCDGTRLRPEANHVHVNNKTIGQIVDMTIVDARRFFESLEFDADREMIAEPLIEEICKRLDFLQKVGTGYLSLNRAADTLSGGELQRVRLATCIGSGLVGVCYVLDEPSIGLHPRDNDRLIHCLRELQRSGNTVIVVEHDEAIMRQADYLIDVGPSAGGEGGQIVAAGTLEEVGKTEGSITAKFLTGRDAIETPDKRRKIAKSRCITLEGAALHNLKSITAKIPLGVFVCITGVSGSGKSSLITSTLAHAIKQRLGLVTPRPGPFSSLRGTSQIEKMIEIDQKPIGRTPRSNAGTYTGVFDEIRKVFASTRQSKQFGFTASRFSFNSKTGRCPDCEGHGVKRVEMNFLPDLFVTCETCDGRRFNRKTLQVRFKDRTIADVLNMSVDEALEFFDGFDAIRRTLTGLSDVGLGYLPLGQPSTTISGGESQRIKLATELSRVANGNTLYLLDEPTTGLHFQDIRRLLSVLNQLVDQGNSVVVIEHNLDVIKSADWVLDLGPEGGQAGGELVAEGTPEDVAEVARSFTGKFLRPILSQ